MNVIVNGQSQNFPADMSVTNLLNALGYEHAYVAVAINRLCIRRTEFSVTEVHDGDEVEVLAPMSGG